MKTFHLPAQAKNKKVFIEFEGVQQRYHKVTKLENVNVSKWLEGESFRSDKLYKTAPFGDVLCTPEQRRMKRFDCRAIDD